MTRIKKNKLSLPLEYNKLAKYFDVLSQGDDSLKNQTIEKILRRHNVVTVLDLTCGTGSQVFWLDKCGYKVTGVDISPALLEIAKNKAQQEKRNINFIEGDMRTISVGNFDAVITIFNAVGHLTKADFDSAIKNINKNLKEDGLYVFDIFNLDAMTDKAVNNLAIDTRKTIGNTEIHHVQYSKLDRDSGYLTSYDQFSIQENSNAPEILDGEFTLKIYSAKELREMLIKNGFEIVGQYGLDGSTFLEETTENILTVAKKRQHLENI